MNSKTQWIVLKGHEFGVAFDLEGERVFICKYMDLKKHVVLQELSWVLYLDGRLTRDYYLAHTVGTPAKYYKEIYRGTLDDI